MKALKSRRASLFDGYGIRRSVRVAVRKGRVR